MGALSVKERIAAKRGEIAANKSKGTRTYAWKPGKTTFRIIPGKDTNTIEERVFGKMWLKSFDEKQKFTIGDRDITFGEHDPIKEMIFAAMRAAPTEEVRDHYKSMLAATKHVFQVLIIDVNGAPDPDAPPTEPQIVEISESQMDNIWAQFEAYADMDPDYDISSKERGHLFTCEKSGKGFDTKYTFLATPKVAPISDEIIAKQHDIDAWIKGEFEGLEAKAVEFLGRLNGAAGISVDVPAGLLGSSSQSNADTAASAAADAVADMANGTATPAPTSTPAPTETGVSAEAVTKVVDAEFEDAPAEPEPAAAAEVESSEIDDILAGLQ